jgi:hypothetical protein
MKEYREIKILDSASNRQRVRTCFYCALAAILALEFFIPKHGHFPWEDAWGFYAAYGFIGCVALIFVAKGLRMLVQRKEDYYD